MGGTDGITGLIEDANSLVSDCYNIGNITTNNISSGGISGSTMYGSVLYCYNTGIIRTNGYSGSNSHCGGITGAVDYGAKIEWCYSKGQVSGYYSKGVGLVTGLINYYTNTAIIRNTYATPYSSFGIVGNNYNGGGTITGNETITVDATTNKNGMQLWSQEEITTKLTDKFVKDEYNLNDGYPILKWQAEELETE